MFFLHKTYEMVKDIDYNAAPLVLEGWISMSSGFGVSEIELDKKELI